nr:troponin T, skeletal muscle-like [Zootoca vivipara]
MPNDSKMKKIIGATGSSQQRRNSMVDHEMDLKELIWSLKEDMGEVKKDLAEIKKEMSDRVKTLEDKVEKLEEKADCDIKDKEEMKCHMKELDEKSLETTRVIEELKLRIQEMENTIKKMTKEKKDNKKEIENAKKDMEKQKMIQEAQMDALAMMQMKLREKTLRFRNIPEMENENTEKRIAAEIAKWLGLDEAGIEKQIEKAFRVNSQKARANNWPMDCLVTFKSSWLVEKILQTKGKKKLRMEDTETVILKEIPPRLIQKRQKYQFLTKHLKAKKIIFRWEYPEGLSFFYKGRRRKFENVGEADIFWRKYWQELGGDRARQIEEEEQRRKEEENIQSSAGEEEEEEEDNGEGDEGAEEEGAKEQGEIE